MKHTGNKNLTFTQRLQIETLNNANMPKAEIAKIVGVHRSTIYKELKKGAYVHTRKSNHYLYGLRYTRTIKYSAQISQDRYDFVCSAKGRPLKVGNDYEFVCYIEKRVKEDKISACAALGQIKRKQLPFKTVISKTTLYRYIKIGIFDNLIIMPRKKSYKKVVMKRAPRGTSIEKRSKEVAERNTFGHWEMDCVCGKTQSVFLVLTERLTRREIIFKMQNQKAESVIKCLNSLEYRYGKLFRKVFKSITVDNGVEFSNFAGMQKSIYRGQRTSIFYCHPYCSSERGSNERMNREIRRLVPKGSDLSKYSANDVKKIEAWLNDYPREIFDYDTSAERFEIELNKIV